MGIFEKMMQSIITTDILILLAFLIELGLFVFVRILASSTPLHLEKQKKKIKKRKRRFSNSLLVNCYNIFTTGISIFPLLGMLGTVGGLLGLDLSAGDMSNIKTNFFMALTSTAWGIVFSIFFKILHASNEYHIEKKINESMEIMNECNELLDKENR